MFYSCLPIIDFFDKSFPQPMFGEEWIGQKGLQMIKVRKSKTEFLTIVNIHLHSDSMFPEKLLMLLSSIFGLGSDCDLLRRDKQMQMVSDHLKKWAKTSPDGCNLIHAGTILLGDTNTPLDDLQQILKVETPKGIRLTGQHDLFSQLEFNIPVNYAKNAAPEDEKQFSGTWKAHPNTPATKLFDGAFATKDSKIALKTEIAWLKDRKGQDISDHAGIVVHCAPKP